jgi:putative ABC transport system substrate-binding protein
MALRRANRRDLSTGPASASRRTVLCYGQRGLVGPPHMRRRDFIGIFGSAVAWPLAARAQQAAMPVIGFLSSSSSGADAPRIEHFRRGLGDAGFVEGGNLVVEYRWAEGRYERLPALAAELVRHPVAVLVGAGVTVAVAAKTVTATIPIVFYTGGDPVKLGLVDSLNKPGGNVTGAVFWGKQLVAKRFELMHELIPKADAIAFLVNPSNAATESEINDVAAADALGQKLIVVKAGTEDDLAGAFATLLRERAGAVVLQGDPLFNSRQGRLAVLSARHGMPTISSVREYPAAGGLMSYGASTAEALRLVGVYNGRILKGERPADLPVQQGTRIELVINVGTAKALDLEIAPTLLARADEVIE